MKSLSLNHYCPSSFPFHYCHFTFAIHVSRWSLLSAWKTAAKVSVFYLLCILLLYTYIYVPNTTHIDLYNTGDEALLKPHDRPQDLRSRGRTRSITRQKIHAPGRRLVTVLEVEERRAVVLSSFSGNLLGINLPLPPPPPLLSQRVEAQQLRTCVRTL